MNPFLTYVQGLQQGLIDAHQFSVSGSVPVPSSADKVLLFSPHPDDECITGLLPLRLMRECGMQIIDVPVTFGSDKRRQAGRAKELAAACAYLGWSVYRETGDLQPLFAEDIAQVIEIHEPKIIFMPHARDWNSRHEATHHLVVAALELLPASFSCVVIETEYWGAMRDPNLMVAGCAEQVADLVAAISLHAEEVARNPFHLLLPAWMQDNVRRGSEIVGGQGGAAPDFSFSTLYRMRNWSNRSWSPVLSENKTVAVDQNILEVFSWK